MLTLGHTNFTMITGTYMLHVSWNDHDLDQSPYTVIVLDPSNGSTSSISGNVYHYSYCIVFPFWLTVYFVVCTVRKHEIVHCAYLDDVYFSSTMNNGLTECKL